MASIKVYVTRQVQSEAVELLKKKCSVEMWASDEAVPREELLAKVKGVDAIFCTLNDEIDEEVLDAAGSQLKMVATMSVATHHIAIHDCKTRGIYVANNPDVASDSAAELTVALLLAVSRRCFEGVEAVKAGEWGLWQPMWLLGPQMTGRTLGIFGLGRVGFGVARRMKPFGVGRIIYSDVSHQSMGDDLQAEYVDLETLIKESDFLVISVGLTGLTKGLFNKEVFKKMKPTAILINTSRGPIVNTQDLTEALQEKEIAAAGLDITDPEPLPEGHPLLNMKNCIVLPHLGTNTTEARLAMAIDTAKNILSLVKAK